LGDAEDRLVPLQNRVTPLGELVAHPARGLVYGNRGCLHDADGRIRRHHATRRWIACRLEFKGWHRGPLMQPGKFTELFFLDEATAFAAGHRPCALCRRADYNRFLELLGETGADAVDLRLHGERLRHHDAGFDTLPDGAFVLHDGEPHLVLGRELLHWTPAGYDRGVPRPRDRARVVTASSFLAVLASGWQSEVPLLHPTASRRGRGRSPQARR
jgi:hypothetical protein